ncbi:hypothetical protein VNO80_23929 [Phaseolus coccineus]|uniref:Uncharacterized protein n=1 Tax=Phaseolus coccineus TaxID=3886 RepID=A0AAN9LRM8_PHACN
MKVGVFYYTQGLNGNFKGSELRQSFSPRVVQWRNLSVHTGCGYQTASSKRLSPNPEQSETHKKKKLKEIIKTFLLLLLLLLLHRRRMNTPATINSPSMNNACISDHRRHVFHENPHLQTFTLLA